MSEEKEQEKQDQNQGIKGKILLIDDDSFLLDMYSLKFKNGGYEVHSVNNPSEAITLIKEGDDKFDIVLFDIIMPGIGGWGFIEAVRKENLIPDTTAIVLSNQGQKSDFENADKYKVDGYVVKALATPSEVLEKIEEIHSKKTKKNNGTISNDNSSSEESNKNEEK